MISNSDVVPRPSGRVVLLTRIKSTTLRLGTMTQAFFRRGEELEATGFENLPHDDPTIVPPKLGFRSFDRVPRHRAPILIAFLLLATAAVLTFGWLSARDLPHGTARVAEAMRARAFSAWARLEAYLPSRPGSP